MINVYVNGKERRIKNQKLYEFLNNNNKNFNYDSSSVVIINGFQTNENIRLKDGDCITIIKKGVMPSKDELEEMLCARHTPRVYEKVKIARVAIAGLGGLGSNIAIELARTGVGTLHLIDFDIVEPSNLNRQNYLIKHLGMFKTEALRKQIQEINPYVSVIVDTIKVDEDNIKSLFVNDQYICEAFDNPESKAMLVNKIMECYPEKKIVAASGMAGYETSNLICTKRVMKNLYICGDGTTEAKVGRGLMAPRVSICAAHQANMILRLIVGEEEP